jgi:RNA recognition motif-containing protein
MKKRLYVAGLACNVTREILTDLFSACGTVETATVMINKITDLPDGYGFVEMSCGSEAQEAIQKLNGAEVEGRTIKVHEARPRPVPPRRGRIDSTMWDSEESYPTKEPLDLPVRKFAWAIMRQALQDMFINESSSSEESDAREQDAAEWFLSDTTDPGSLTWVCDILQIQPWMLRKWLSMYHQRNRQQREPMVRELFRSLRPSIN